MPARKAAVPIFSDATSEGQLGFDPAAAVTHLASSDRRLERLITAAGPYAMTLRTTPSIFVALSEAIVHQQLNGRAAATIYGRLCSLFPRPSRGPDPKRLLLLPDADLRGAGLSAAKTRALRDLAEKTLSKAIPTIGQAHKLDNEEIIAQLTTVRGIGRWTVEMLLMSRLGRPDVLPVDDFGVRKGFMLTYRLPEMPTKQELTARAERWRPYRSVASWYLWRAVDLSKEGWG